MKRTIRITFLLPGGGYAPVGGYKIVYEYANRLAARGHQITVVHPAMLRADETTKEMARASLRYLYRKFIADYTPKQWFDLSPSVNLLWVPSLATRHIPEGDAVIATAWQTSEWVAQYPCSKGKKNYLIQGLETWRGMDKRALATWRLPLRKFVIAQYLMKVGRELGVRVEYQPNGLDFRRFSLLNPPNARNPTTVMMLYHKSEFKGCDDGLNALFIVHKSVPELRVTLFGTPAKPSNLPSWTEYYQLPEQTLLPALYNRNAIFLAPSLTEGWALPPAEAMMCGAAVVATDIGGHQDYGFHEKTALLAPVKSPELLAANILRLIRDNTLRAEIAMAGNRFIQSFTWERSIERFEGALLEDKSDTLAPGIEK